MGRNPAPPRRFGKRRGGTEVSSSFRASTEASAEVLFDTGGRSLDRPVLLSSRGGGPTIEAPRDPRSEVGDEHRSPRAQNHSRAPSHGARAAEARAPRLLTAAVARSWSSRNGGGLREPRHPAGGGGRPAGGLG